MFEIVINDVFDGREYCAYGHYADGQLFYVGAGPIARAFDFGNGKRSDLWHSFRNGQNVSVVLFDRFVTRAEAHVVARRLIVTHRPWANQTDTERQNRSLLDNASGTVIVCSDGRSWPNIAAAVVETGISQGAISNSVSGRYPLVRGLRFSRVAKP